MYQICFMHNNTNPLSIYKQHGLRVMFVPPLLVVVSLHVRCLFPRRSILTSTFSHGFSAAPGRGSPSRPPLLPASGEMTLSNGSVISTLMEEEVEEEGDEQQHQVRMEDRQSYGITFPDFPGGPGTFEAAAKFCYGFRVELTAWNVAPLRCVAEYPEMTEEHAEDNLAVRAEAYLGQTLLRHPGKATKALKSCEELLPHAEELGIVGHCVEAIVTRSSAASRSWFDDLAVLGLHMYKWVGGGGRGSGGVGCAGGREGPAGGGAVWVKEWAMFLDVCVDRAGMDVGFRPAAKLPGQL